MSKENEWLEVPAFLQRDAVRASDNRTVGNLRNIVRCKRRNWLPPWIENNRTLHRLWRATPPWLTDEQLEKMIAIYNARRNGEQVDHIVPLCNPIVCGLNVPWNLQLLTQKANLQKSNHDWPDCPHEVVDLFGPHEPYQLRLL